jgi:hypothetical protein
MSVLQNTPPPGLLARSIMRGSMKAALIAQLALAGLLVRTDIAGQLFSGADPIAPRVQALIASCDQTRCWSPADVSSRPGDDAPEIVMPAGDDGLAFRTATDAGLGLAPALTGAFRAGDDARLERHLDALPAPPDAAVFHSPGGNVVAAPAIGRAIRDRGLTTAVQSARACNTACPSAFGGGVRRIASRGAGIGVHQTFFIGTELMSPNRAACQIQILKARMMQFWQDMGVGRAIETLATQTPADRVLYLVETELTALRLSTEMSD